MLVGVKDLKVFCIIGCLPEEEEAEQEIYFDIEVEIKKPSADSIDNTLNYLLLKETAENFAHKNSYRLIETLAHDVAASLVETMDISSARVRVKKPSAVPNAHHAFAEEICTRE